MKKKIVMLYKFLKNGKISPYFEPNGNYYKNICYLNSTRIKTNTECCKRFIEESGKKYIAIDFKYDNKKRTCDVWEGMPVIATVNIKDKNLLNTMEFIIEETDIEYKKIKVNNKWYKEKELTESFISSFCMTVYKYQGADINEHNNIFYCNRMDKKQLYNAFSRTTKFEYIHLEHKILNNIYFNRKMPVLQLCNAKFNSL